MFFDSEFGKQFIETYMNESPIEQFVKINYSLGAVVLYSYDTEQFVILSHDTPLTNLDRYISIGVILEDIGNMKYIVMFKNVLNHNIEQIKHVVSSKDAGGIVVSKFRDYCKRFKKKLTDEQYKIWKNIDFILPGNKQMDLIHQNKDTIIERVTALTNVEKAKELKEKLNNNNIFCNIAGHTVIWHEPTKHSPVFYEMIDNYTSGYFLPVFILDLTKINYNNG